MQTINLTELNFSTLIASSMRIKSCVIASICAVFLLMVYGVDIRAQYQHWQFACAREKLLQQEIAQKQLQATNLATEQSQLQTSEQLFKQALQQLPADNAIPGLLDNMAKMALANGLIIKSLKPLAIIRQKNHFTVLPVQIIAVGNYHQLVQFIRQINTLDYRVSWQNFNITQDNSATATNLSAEHLAITITAQIYQYNVAKTDENNNA